MKKLKGILLALLSVACISVAAVVFAGCDDEETSSAETTSVSSSISAHSSSKASSVLDSSIASSVEDSSSVVQESSVVSSSSIANSSSSVENSSSSIEDSSSVEESSSSVEENSSVEESSSSVEDSSSDSSSIEDSSSSVEDSSSSEGVGDSSVEDSSSSVEEEKIPSEGLKYTLNADKISYLVTGIGTCTDTDLRIPAMYNNLPVTGIAGYAFDYDRKLTSVSIPDSVTTIGEWAFYKCENLTSVVIGDSVTKIGNGVFSNCKALKKIQYNARECADLGPKNGVLATAGQNGDGIKVMIGANVKKIPAYLFCPYDNVSFHKITSVEFEEGSVCESIGNYAFNHSNSLMSIKIPDSVTTIGDQAFYFCENLTSVIIGDSVTTIGDYAFRGCNSLTSVVIPNSVTTIGDTAFDCSSLTIYCEETSKPSGWSSWWRLFNCPVVWDCNHNDVATDGYIYTVVDGIRYGIKEGIATVVAQPRNVTTVNILESIIYKGVEYSVNMIGENAFYWCDSLASIEIPDSVTTIGKGAFTWCFSLTSVLMGDSVTTIGGSTFDGCSNLTSIEIPDSVTSLGRHAFSNCDSLTIYCEVGSLPSDWESEWNYSSCPVVWDCDNNDVATDRYIYTVINGIRYGIKNGVATVVRQPSHITIADISGNITYKGVEYSVTTIGEEAFYDCDSLISVVIGNSVTTIGNYAFDNCSSLTSVVIPDGVTTIGYKAFQYCTNLTSITFEGTMEEWNAISKGTNWKYNVPATEVVCKDGVVTF